MYKIYFLLEWYINLKNTCNKHGLEIFYIQGGGNKNKKKGGKS